MRYKRHELKRPPVREVAMGLVYEPRLSYSLVPGFLHSRLIGQLPVLQENPNGLWGPSLGTQAGPLHRFVDEDQTCFVQIGHGILMVNQVGGYDFSSFCELVKLATSSLREVGALGDIERATLRYINVFRSDLISDISEPFTVSWSLPDTGISSDHGFTFRFPQFIDSDSPSVYSEFTFQEDEENSGGSKMDTVLDLVTEDNSPSDIFVWLKVAHERIYQAFRNVIADELHERMKGDNDDDDAIQPT